MARPPSNQAEIDAGNQIAAYITGWVCGAKAAVPNPAFTQHSNSTIVDAYHCGYSQGVDARNNALHKAAARYGYDPSPLR